MEKRSADVGGISVTWREAGDGKPILYVHGVPDAGVMWRPFLERTGGIAPDMPGFGESGKPASFSYSIKGYGDWLEQYVDHLGLDRFVLVVHDWGGGMGLELAMRRPEAIERLVVIDSVPLLPGYRWHRFARIWRAPVGGELSMGFSGRWIAKRLLLMEKVVRREHADAFVDEWWPYFDHGTQRAILRLYRSAPPDVLARAGERLGDVKAPALVLWGAEDTFLPTEFAHKYGEALGGETRVEIVPGALHWIWLEQPKVIDTVADFLGGS